MTTLTSDQLAALARSGATNREIEATLGREMTEAERTVVDRARVVGRLNKTQKRARTAAERMAAMEERRASVKRRPPKDPARRAQLEADPAAWLRHYLAQAYIRPFEKPHLAIIDGALRASDTAGRFAIVAERGIGKSTLLWGLILFLKLSGRQNFPVCLPWSSAPLKRAFTFWKTALCFNRRLDADYPEFTAPFAHSRGVAQRMASQTWSDTGASCGARLQIGDGMIVFPDNRGVIGGSTINGNPKGLNYPQEDGTVLRPTLALIDDVQDRKVAKSPDLVADTIVKIDGDLGGLGEAGVDFPMLISGNCTRPRDVMAHYLAEEGWQSVLVSCVEKWPDGWEDAGSDCRRLWEEWRGLFLNDEREALAFYLDAGHRGDMTAGMVLSAPGSYQVTKTTPDAYYGAMRSYYKMGHDAFYAEKQQQPIDEGVTDRPYDLTPELICSRVDPARKAFDLPAWVEDVVFSTDLNPSYAFSSAAVGFGRDQTAAVLWYGVYDDAPLPIMGNEPGSEEKRKFFEALVRAGKELSEMPFPPKMWALDCSGSYFDVVIRFCGESLKLCGIQGTPFRGVGWKPYNPFGKGIIGTPREMCHMRGDEADGRRRRWVAWHTDYWGEVAQKAWLGSVGAPGSLSLFAGKHDSLAQQVCNQPLIRTGTGLSGKQEWIWGTRPGVPHDFHDVLAQAYAAAAWGGIGTGGAVVRPARPARIVRDRPPSRVCDFPIDERSL